MKVNVWTKTVMKTVTKKVALKFRFDYRLAKKYVIDSFCCKEVLKITSKEKALRDVIPAKQEGQE